MKKLLVIALVCLTAAVYADDPATIRIDTAIYNGIMNGTYDIRGKTLMIQTSSLDFDEFQTAFYSNYIGRVLLRHGQSSTQLPRSEQSILDRLWKRIGDFDTRNDVIFVGIIICDYTYGIILYYMNDASLPEYFGWRSTGVTMIGKYFFEIKRH